MSLHVSLTAVNLACDWVDPNCNVTKCERIMQFVHKHSIMSCLLLRGMELFEYVLLECWRLGDTSGDQSVWSGDSYFGPQRRLLCLCFQYHHTKPTMIAISTGTTITVPVIAPPFPGFWWLPRSSVSVRSYTMNIYCKIIILNNCFSTSQNSSRSTSLSFLHGITGEGQVFCPQYFLVKMSFRWTKDQTYPSKKNR